MHGAAPLAYDEDLASAAQEWAETLDEEQSGLHHSAAEGYGENLAYYFSSDPD
jgi:uncharacterized protein YkwD